MMRLRLRNIELIQYLIQLQCYSSLFTKDFSLASFFPLETFFQFKFFNHSVTCSSTFTEPAQGKELNCIEMILRLFCISFFFRETSEQQSRKKKIYFVQIFLIKIKPALLILFIAGKFFLLYKLHCNFL
jgi:hypothetical protein